MAVYPSHRLTQRITFAAVAVAAVLIVSICVVFALNQRPQLAASDFQKVQIGISRTDLHKILGRPHHEQIVLGKVTSPTSITVNFSTGEAKKRLKGSGFSDHILDCWFSPSITIHAYVDASDQVVCRYSTGGQQTTFLRRIWPQRRVYWHQEIDRTFRLTGVSTRRVPRHGLG